MSATHSAVLAICSDLDETPDADTYFEIMRFLNTTQETRMGRGVGLEVGNTIYFDMPPGHFSYWSAGERDRERMRLLIKSGHIDCLHSYGDLATTRAHAEKALDELENHGCRLRVWIDHAQAPSNFGSDIMRGHGDEPGHAVYHADLTIRHGVRYVWRGRVSSVVAQNRPFSLKAIWAGNQPAASARTLVKEAAKQLLSKVGNPKYAPHAGNSLLVPGRLRDGTTITEFVRSNPSWAGVSGHDRGDEIHQVLNVRYLDRLVSRGGYSILYTHLGKLDRSADRRALPPASVCAFRLLADYQAAGKIRVMTTARLLDHASSGKPAGAPLHFPDI